MLTHQKFHHHVSKNMWFASAKAGKIFSKVTWIYLPPHPQRNPPGCWLVGIFKVFSLGSEILKVCIFSSWWWVEEPACWMGRVDPRCYFIHRSCAGWTICGYGTLPSDCSSALENLKNGVLKKKDFHLQVLLVYLSMSLFWRVLNITF